MRIEYGLRCTTTVSISWSILVEYASRPWPDPQISILRSARPGAGAKTSIKLACQEQFDFLGYTFGPWRYRKTGSLYLGTSPSKKSVSRLRQKVGDLLMRSNVDPWPEVRDQLNAILRGWSSYFCCGSRYLQSRAVDQYVYDRVLHFPRRRCKVHSRGTTRFSYAAVSEELGVLRLRDVALGVASVC
jgi:RNA-directed DNA polymerase